MTDEEYNHLVELRNKCYRDRRYRETEINYFTGFNDGYEKGKEILAEENAELKKINADGLSELNHINGELIIENEKLCKENAELKAQLESERDLPAIAYMQGAEKQKKKDEEELKKWKDEWQEQVQKATDEGYARTLQTMQLTKATEIIKTLADNLSMYSGNYQKELLEAKQFLKENSTYERIQKAKYNYTD